MKKEYSEMNMDELDQAKYALEDQRRELKANMREAADDNKELIHQQIKEVRSEMLIIQSFQDRLLTPPPRKPGTQFSISLKGIPSQAKIGIDSKSKRNKK